MTLPESFYGISFLGKKRKNVMDTECNQIIFNFPSCKKKKVQAEFSGGNVTSDGGVLLIREADRKTNLMQSVSKILQDSRQKNKCDHSFLSLLRQRVYGLCLGYEDLNDHLTLRNDIAFQTAVDRDEVLSGDSTLCRLENRADRSHAVQMNACLVEHFITRFKKAPKELILDFDATDDIVHGMQEGRFFNGFYDNYCFLPLYVFCGNHLLTAYLRPSNQDAARHSWAILSLLVKRFRKSWPDVRIIFRGDCGFFRWRMLSWCEKHDVHYVVGAPRNHVLLGYCESLIQKALSAYELTKSKFREFTEFKYAAQTWDHERRIIAKIECLDKGLNPRFVVTNLSDDPAVIYDELYVKRGDMENRIKEQQLDLFADRTSCHKWWPNQFRLLLSGLAYTLMNSVREIALKGTELATAQCQTIRLKLLKIGAVILRNSRKIYFRLSSAYPYQSIFIRAAQKLTG
jgi:hypothetical protein